MCVLPENATGMFTGILRVFFCRLPRGEKRRPTTWYGSVLLLLRANLFASTLSLDDGCPGLAHPDPPDRFAHQGLDLGHVALRVFRQLFERPTIADGTLPARQCHVLHLDVLKVLENVTPIIRKFSQLDMETRIGKRSLFLPAPSWGSGP